MASSSAGAATGGETLSSASTPSAVLNLGATLCSVMGPRQLNKKWFPASSGFQ